MPIREETQGGIISLALLGNILVLPPEELVEVAGERNIWTSLVELLPPRTEPG